MSNFKYQVNLSNILRHEEMFQQNIISQTILSNSEILKIIHSLKIGILESMNIEQNKNAKIQLLIEFFKIPILADKKRFHVSKRLGQSKMFTFNLNNRENGVDSDIQQRINLNPLMAVDCRVQSVETRHPQKKLLTTFNRLFRRNKKSFNQNLNMRNQCLRIIKFYKILFLQGL